MGRLTWMVIYRDGTTYSQYDPMTGSERDSGDIDRRGIGCFVLRDEQQVPVYALHLEPGQVLIYRRRVKKSVGEENFTTCHLVGWRSVHEEDDRDHMAFIWEGGARIEVISRYYPEHPWFYAPTLLSCEESLLAPKTSQSSNLEGQAS